MRTVETDRQPFRTLPYTSTRSPHASDDLRFHFLTRIQRLPQRPTPMTRVAEQENYEQCMPFARQPLKGIYVAQRMFTTLVMVLWWALYYSIMPRSRRPRQSWSLKQIICVNFTRRIYKVTELAGVTWGTRNPEKACKNESLKETRFEWIDPLPEELRSGIVVDSQAQCKRVGVFIWPKDAPQGT